MKIKSLIVGGLVATLWAIPAQAQQGTMELGMDAGLVFTMPDIEGLDNTLDVIAPFQYVRMGFFVTDQFSIEPTASFVRMDFGDDAMTQFAVLASGLYHFTADRTQPQFFLQATGGLEYTDFGDVASDTQWFLGGGVGLKMRPLRDFFAVRLGALYMRAFESDEFGAANMLRGHVGVSVYIN
jgi:hypothetical protein